MDDQPIFHNGDLETYSLFLFLPDVLPKILSFSFVNDVVLLPIEHDQKRLCISTSHFAVFVQSLPTLHLHDPILVVGPLGIEFKSTAPQQTGMANDTGLLQLNFVFFELCSPFFNPSRIRKIQIGSPLLSTKLDSPNFGTGNNPIFEKRINNDFVFVCRKKAHRQQVAIVQKQSIWPLI